MLASRLPSSFASLAKLRLATSLMLCPPYTLSRSPLVTLAIRYGIGVEAAREEKGGQRFSEFLSDKNIIKQLAVNGIETMFPVQEETFKIIAEGVDILASDRTGSGKTLGYTLPVLEKFNRANYHLTKIDMPKFLILCPTRELVLQVTTEIANLKSAYKVAAIYGGSSTQQQMDLLRSGVAIVVATPGRLQDLINRNAVKL